MSQVKCFLVAFSLATAALAAHSADDTFGDAGGVLDEETRVYLGPCFFSEISPQPPAKPMPLGAILGVALKETLVDFAVGALKAAGEDKSTQAIAAYPANGWMYQFDTQAHLTINPQARCVQIVSGSFWNGLRLQGQEDVASAPSRDSSRTVPLDGRQRTLVHDADGSDVSIARWKTDKPLFGELKGRFRQLRWARFFFEARLDQLAGSDDKFVLAPNALYFEKPVDGSFFDLFGSAKRNVLVTITFATAGAEVGRAFASVNFPFRDVPGGTLLTPLYFKEHTSRAIQAPELTDDEKKTVLAKKTLLDNATAEVSLAKGPPSAPEYIPPDSFDNPAYLQAAQTYCSALVKFNASAKKIDKKAVPLTAPECPVELQIDKLSLTNARATFDKGVAKEQAIFDTMNVWVLKPDDPNFSGVTCDFKSAGQPTFDAGCSLPKASNVRPITVSASVVEVRQGSKFAAFLGKVLEKAQPGINAAIEASTPEKKAEADEQSKQNQEAYQLAVADVAIAEAKLAEVLAKSDATASDKAQAQHDLLDKKIAANQAARKAGVSEPYKVP